MIHRGQIGAVIRLTSTTDLSTALSLSIRYRKPSGAAGVWTATLSGTTDIEYTTTAATDLDQAGAWTFQGYATYFGGTDDYTSQVQGAVGDVIVV